MRTHNPAIQADYVFVVQPSDSADVKDDSNNDLDAEVVTLYYGGASAASIAIRAASEPGTDNVTLTNVQPGSFLPIMVRRVLSTGTTASAGTIFGLAGKR